MAVLKERLNRKNVDTDTYDIIHFETSSDIVLCSDGTSVENKLQSLLTSKLSTDLSNVSTSALLNKGKEAGLLDKTTATKLYVTSDSLNETLDQKADNDLSSVDNSVFFNKGKEAGLVASDGSSGAIPNTVITGITFNPENWEVYGQEGTYRQQIVDERIKVTHKLNLSVSIEQLRILTGIGVTGLVAVNNDPSGDGNAYIYLCGTKPTQDKISVDIELVEVKEVV